MSARVQATISPSSKALKPVRTPTRCSGRKPSKSTISDHDAPSSAWDGFRRTSAAVGAAAVLAVGTLTSSPPSWAFSERNVAEFQASGLIFKDAVQVVGIGDPEVEGVTLYYSDFKRSFADKLSNLDFFNEPSQASITCAATGPVRIKDEAQLGGSSGKDMFSEGKGRALVFFSNKTLKIRRIYDEEKRALLYVSYSSRWTSAGEEGNGVSTGRYRTSICAIPVPYEAQSDS